MHENKNVERKIKHRKGLDRVKTQIKRWSANIKRRQNKTYTVHSTQTDSRVRKKTLKSRQQSEKKKKKNTEKHNLFFKFLRLESALWDEKFDQTPYRQVGKASKGPAQAWTQWRRAEALHLAR